MSLLPNKGVKLKLILHYSISDSEKYLDICKTICPKYFPDIKLKYTNKLKPQLMEQMPYPNK